MKKYKEVEKNRIQYHKAPLENSVHRSSLLISEFPGADAEISFLNHFLLKRSYDSVACRVTGIDGAGNRIKSLLHKVTEPRVYTLDLSGMFGRKAASYIVEFFSSENLFIPFPAVMVNHRGEGFINVVHAYNRVLNDVFENDSINEVRVKEASIDVRVDDTTDTFVLLSAGHLDCKGTIGFELGIDGRALRLEKTVNLKRFQAERYAIGELFGLKSVRNDATLKIQQPAQHMFYGRLLAGQAKKGSAMFSANHSYYDTSSTEEYWEDAAPSSRVYPFFAGLKNAVRIYPIISPGVLKLSVRLFGRDGSEIGKWQAGSLSSPGGGALEIDVGAGAEKLKLSQKAAAFELSAVPEGGNTPARIGHQLVYQKGGALHTSINVALNNPNVFAPAGKRGFAWGQIVASEDVVSYFGLVFNTVSGEAADVEIEFYDGSGKLSSSGVRIQPGGALLLNTDDHLGQIAGNRKPNGRYIWYMVKCSRPDITAYGVSMHKKTEHCTGEHSF